MLAQHGQSGRGRGRQEYSRYNDNNSNEPVPGTDGNTLEDVTCYGCQFRGHYRNMCPHVNRSGIISAHVGYMLTQDDGLFNIPKIWILLDTCSTCDVANNPDIVSNIRDCDIDEKLTAYTNRGAQSYNKSATLKILPITVHFKEASMANIICMKTITNIPGARVRMDSITSTSFILELISGKTYKFKQYRNGLYYLDINEVINNSNATINEDTNKSNATSLNYTFLQTVDNNKKYFSNAEINRADKSRYYQEYLFYPSTSTMKQYVNGNQINNCDVTVDNINRGELIYGPLTPYLQGHMTRRKPVVHKKIEKISLPPIIKLTHPALSLSIDFFYVNKNMFFTLNQIKWISLPHNIAHHDR